MRFLLILPFFLQAIVIGVDEFYFHVKRGLPLWERIGHPLDTLSLLACFIFVLLFPFSTGTLKIYVALTLFSCLMVTKDEWVHKEVCPGSENWLHAILFINHPIVLTSLGLLWWRLPSYEWASLFLKVQASLVALFMFYQIVYWNLIWKKKSVSL